ncbi:hypothetical protein FPSE_05539 [Fusarium pseudograminearum CS3096]|uniref:Uncharacterized protein n=2 Tax=Fusarium pseudograminearum TaxID=101028 RepID=K3VI83_FUSPC|nr:hypothetical protein FPSE_05539 [Fusarium pseudograminearum CS3096]EKJ74242.1 hypothetical protein FPSE_05539 [Fusarium pseudograminearum CS3096]KAF0642200.1 hypothetical protein FPSE5266_05539 [Fusarium pseudograminearum]CEG02863.1 unnamed protein product [Fusarium pseudograminearum CS3487]
MGDPLGYSAKAKRLREYHRRWMSQVDDTPMPPDDIYHVELEAAKKKVQDANQACLKAAASGDVASSIAFFTRAVEQQEEIKLRVKQKEAENKEECEVREFLDILGRPFFERVYIRWLAGQQTLSTPAQESVDEEACPITAITELQLSPQVLSPQQPTSADSSSAIPSAIPTPPADDPSHPRTTRNKQQDLAEGVGRPTFTPSTRNGKRPPSPKTVPDSANKRIKKPDRRDRPTGPFAKRTITFAEVHDDGNAAKRYWIEEFRFHYYILECKDKACNILFDRWSPVRHAMAHLKGPKHLNNHKVSLNYAKVLSKFGTQVVDCTSELLEENNKVTLRAINGDERAQTRESIAINADNNEDSARCAHDDSAAPQPGQVFETNYDDAQNSVVLILPWECCDRRGIPQWVPDVESTELIKVYHPCHWYSHSTRTYIWAPTYELHTSKSAFRKYPVMYFEGSQFPQNRSFNWVNLQDLTAYNPQDSNVSYKSQVDKYLHERRRLLRCKTRPAKGSVAGTDNTDDDTSATESSDDSPSAGTPNSSPGIEPLSMTGDRVVRRPVFRAPNPSSSYGIGPRSYGEPSRASGHFSDSEQHADQMEVDSRTIRDSEDSCLSKTTTHENGPHSRSTLQCGPAVNRHGPTHQEDENMFMSDDAHAGPSSARAVVPSEARANPKMQAWDETMAALDNVLNTVSSTSKTAQKQG